MPCLGNSYQAIPGPFAAKRVRGTGCRSFDQVVISTVPNVFRGIEPRWMRPFVAGAAEPAIRSAPAARSCES